MAQSGFTPIQIYFSTTPGNVPLAGNLANGELALNTADGILFYKDSSGVVEVLASGSSVSILSVVVATTVNLASLSGLLTIDGVLLTAGQRVLVKNQTLSQNNGVYLASAGAWTRSIDANSSAEIAGRIITVRSGTTQGGQQWATTFKSTDTLGTTAMSWFQVALQNTAVTFTDLTTTGNMVFGNADTDTITENASYVAGTQLKSAKVSANTLSLAAYDVDGAAYTNLITLTASNTPTLTLTSTGVGTINNMSIGATTASTGAFTTLSATGNVTLGDADADTITQAASYVTGTQLKSAKLNTNTLSLAAYDVDGAAYANLITLTASNTPTLALTSTGVGTINNMSIGATTASTGAFTTLSSTGDTTIGDASADTLTVNATPTFLAKPLVQLTTATTNAVTQVFQLNSQSSGTPASGIGVGMEFAVETAAGNTEVGATINAVTTDVTATSEDFDLVFNTMAAGAAASEGLRVKNTGGVTIPTVGTYQINGVSVLSSTALGATVVSSSLTSVGTIATGVWQGTVIGATYGGTGVNNGARTLTINTNAGTIAFSGASTTMTFPSTSQTLAGLGLSQTFTAAQTIQAPAALRVENAATQDAVVLAGRAGGTGSFATTLTPGTLAGNITLTLPIATTTLAGLGIAQTYTAAQTFRAVSAVRSEAAATQDAVVLAGRAGGTSSFAVTLTPTTLTANRTITLPDGDIVLPTGTYAVLGTAQTFTAAQTFRAANAVRSEAAATQDAIVLAGRAGGTGSFGATITTATLAASVTHTLPAITGTLATLANTAQTFTGATTISNTATFSNIVTMSGTTTNIDIGTSQTSGTLTLGGTAQTGAITLGRSTAAQTINIGTGVNTSATKTINIGTGATTAGATTISIGPVNAAAQLATTQTLYGPWTASSALSPSYPSATGLTISNAETGAYGGLSSPGVVSLIFKTSADDGGGSFSPPYEIGRLEWTETSSAFSPEPVVTLSAYNNSNNQFGLYYKPSSFSVYLGTTTTSTLLLYGGAGSTAVGALALTANVSGGGIPAPLFTTAVGTNAGLITLSGTGPVTVGDYNTFVGYQAGYQTVATSTTGLIGQGNTVLGFNAGAYDTVSGSAGYGNFNTFVGAQAGAVNSKTLGNNNICIGYGAGSGLPTSIADTLVLGGNMSSTYEIAMATGDVLIGNGNGAPLFQAVWNSTAYSVLQFNAGNAITLQSAGGISFYDNQFKIIDNVDPTKTAVFDATGITTATTRIYTLPNASGTLALLELAQTWSATQTFGAVVLNSTVTSGNIAFTLSGTTSNLSLNAGQTTGAIVVGGTAGTGAITVGQSTGAQILNLGTGATTSGTTKTVNIGTAGVSGSITNINIGSAVAGANGTITLTEQVVVYQPTPASISTTATLTNANIQARIINTTGTTYTVTMPLGTTMETLVPWAGVDLGYDFTIINTASGIITMAVNTGVTSLGALTIITGTSAQFRIRRTAANTFILYRMS